MSEQNEPVLWRFVQTAHDNAKTLLQNQLRSLGTITIEEVYCIIALLKIGPWSPTALEALVEEVQSIANVDKWKSCLTGWAAWRNKSAASSTTKTSSTTKMIAGSRGTYAAQRPWRKGRGKRGQAKKVPRHARNA